MKRCLAIVVLATSLQAMTQELPSKQAPPPIKQAPKGPRANLDPGLPAYEGSASVSGQIRSVGVRIMSSIEGRTSIMELWRDAFSKVQPNALITLDAEHTVTPALIEGRSDIGPLNRELIPSEIAAFEGRFGYRPTTVCVAGGSWRTPNMTFALAFFVNKANPLERLSLDQLDSIYSKSRKRGHKEDISTWGQLGLKGEWANRPIKLYGISAPGGTTGGIMNFVQERILLRGEYKDGITYYESPAFAKLTDAVGRDPAGIGYAGFAHVEANANVKSIALAEKPVGPYYSGTFEDVASYRYPLSRFVFIHINRAPGKPVDPTVREFLRFVLSKEGQRIVQEDGHWIPLPAAIVKRERAKLE